jgi:hypothetical protein
LPKDSSTTIPSSAKYLSSLFEFSQLSVCPFLKVTKGIKRIECLIPFFLSFYLFEWVPWIEVV